MQALLSLCPPPPRRWARSAFPEWHLPLNIVLKKEKEGWREEFDTELATYEKLRCLQGHVIPVCYGQIEYDGARTLVLSDVGGECLAEPQGATLEEDELRPLLDQALRALAALRMSHSDLKLDNFRLVNGVIVIVDFERVDEHASREEAEALEPFDLKFLMKGTGTTSSVLKKTAYCCLKGDEGKGRPTVSLLYLPGSRFWPVEVNVQFIDERVCDHLGVFLTRLLNRRTLFSHCTALEIDVSLISLYNSHLCVLSYLYQSE